MTVDALALLFRRLVLAAQSADALARPIDVGELLDKFVPYRSARRDGALETNDDYLHCMMELLAGEREYLFVDELMQDDLRNELKSSNPDLSLIRLYLNTKVRISTTAAQAVLAGNTDIDLRPPTPVATPVVPVPPAPVATERIASSEPPAIETPAKAPKAKKAATPRRATPRATPSASMPATPIVPTAVVSAPPVQTDGGCPYCAQPLPSDRPTRYCPNCGFDLHVRRCAGCSAEIEAEWKYCVTCGRSAA